MMMMMFTTISAGLLALTHCMANILSLPKEEGGDDGEIKMSRIKF